MTWDDRGQTWIVKESPTAKDQVVYPDNEQGEQKTWRWEHTTVMSSLNVLSVRKDRPGRDYIYYKRRPHEQGVVSVSSWFDAKYSATEHGTAVLKDLFGKSPFSYPKSIHAVRDAIYIAGGSIHDSRVLDFFAGSGTTGHAVINLNREDDGKRKFILVEMGDYFDTILMPRIKKVAFSPDWRDGKPTRKVTATEAKRSPRLIKYIRLEGYDDSLNNITFNEVASQKTFQFDDYLINYMIGTETRGSDTLLNIDKLASPFSYKLTVTQDGQSRAIPVDLMETFSYLLGLHVMNRAAYYDEKRRYVIFRGTLDSRTVVVIWRDIKDWTKDDFERDRKFVEKQQITESADEIFVNGDSVIPNARSLDPVFKSRMFAPIAAGNGGF